MVDGDKDIVEATTNLMEIFGIDVVGLDMMVNRQ